MSKTKITVRKHSSQPALQSPSFSVQYSAKEPLVLGKSLLTEFKSSAAVIMQLNTSGAGQIIKDTESYALSLIETAKKYAVDYRYSKAKPESSGTALAKLFSFNKPAMEHELLFFLNDIQWHSEACEKIRSLIPIRYFILNKDVNTDTVLDEMHNMMDRQKFQICSSVIFDWPEIGQMGISSLKLAYEDVISHVDNVKREYGLH